MFKGVFFETSGPLLVDYLYLLSYRLFMNFLEDGTYELGTHATKNALRATLIEYLIVTRCLKHGHVVLFLILSYLTADSHSLCKKLYELVVQLVNLLTQSVYSLGCHRLIAYDQKTENIVEHIRSDLLFGIAPRVVG